MFLGEKIQKKGAYLKQGTAECRSFPDKPNDPKRKKEKKKKKISLIHSLLLRFSSFSFISQLSFFSSLIFSRRSSSTISPTVESIVSVPEGLEAKLQEAEEKKIYMPVLEIELLADFSVHTILFLEDQR